MKIKLPNGVALETESDDETALLLEKLGLVPKEEAKPQVAVAAAVRQPSAAEPSAAEPSAPAASVAEPPAVASVQSVSNGGQKAWNPLRVGLFVDKFDAAAASGRVLHELYRGPVGGITTMELAKLIGLENTKGLGSVLGTYRRLAEEMGEPSPVESFVGREGFKVFVLDQQFRSGWTLLKQQKGAA